MKSELLKNIMTNIVVYKKRCGKQSAMLGRGAPQTLDIYILCIG